MESINVIFDIVLIVFSIWMAYMAKKGVGGLIGKAIFIMNFGIIILGLSGITATLLQQFSDAPVDVQSFVQRSIVLIGFFFLLAGFHKIRSVASGVAVK